MHKVRTVVSYLPEEITNIAQDLFHILTPTDDLLVVRLWFCRQVTKRCFGIHVDSDTNPLTFDIHLLDLFLYVYTLK
jgi:hypothetical protein